VCIEFHLGDPVYRIIKGADYEEMSSSFSRHRRFGHAVTWEDVEVERLEILHNTDHIEVSANGTSYRISVSIKRERYLPNSQHLTYNANFEVETLSQPTRETDRRS
jgi:hypothetical protein